MGSLNTFNEIKIYTGTKFHYYRTTTQLTGLHLAIRKQTNKQKIRAIHETIHEKIMENCNKNPQGATRSEVEAAGE